MEARSKVSKPTTDWLEQGIAVLGITMVGDTADVFNSAAAAAGESATADACSEAA